MNATRWARGLTGLLAGLVAAASSAAGQGLAQRVAAAPDGAVRFTYAARPDVCGDGHTVYLGDAAITFTRSSSMNMSNGDRRDDVIVDVCGRPEAHTARLVLAVSGHRVRGVRAYVGGTWHAPEGPTTDLGTVPAPAAADYLVQLVSSAEVDGGSQAIFGAMVADSVEVWRGLLALAKNEQRPRRARESAVFWLAQAAGDSAAAGLNALVADSTGDRDVRSQAVFALSQLPHDTGVPLLINVARTNRDPAIRRKALFWLGQSHDPRALNLFEELLLRN